MYCRIAFSNVRKSLCDYAIYFTTIMLGVAAFYAFNSLAAQCDFFSDQVSLILRCLSDMVVHLTVFLAGVLGFLMVYANNYIMRRRKRELGLYQILGMRVSQISFILVLETLIASLASLLAGFAFGILLSQLMTFVTAALFHETIKNFKFIFSSHAFMMTLTCYAVIFFVMLAFNLCTLARVRLSVLMQADRQNEKVRIRNLPLSIGGAAVGLGLIILAYVRILHDGYPFNVYPGGPEWIQFLITTCLGIVGTLLFFFALSGAIFMINRLWKRHYYRGLNMFTARQLASRINSTSISMGVISLVLFFAMTFVTSGIALCNSYVDKIVRHVPFDASVLMFYNSDPALSEDPATDPAMLKGMAAEPFDVAQDLKTKGFDISQESRAMSQVVYRKLPSDTELMRSDSSKINDLQEEILGTPSDSHEADACSVSEDHESFSTYKLLTVSLSDYNGQRKLRGMSDVSLSDTECLVLCDKDSFSPEKKALNTIASVNVGNRRYRVRYIDEESAIMSNSYASSTGAGEVTIILPDSVASGFPPCRCALNVQCDAGKAGETSVFEEIKQEFCHSGRFRSRRLQEGSEVPAIYEAFQNGRSVGSLEIPILREEALEASTLIQGIVSYFAVYVGFVFIVCCATILAVQQLCSTVDTAVRYRLLSEIGCPRRLANRSLSKQTAYVFVLPFGMALCHSAVAMKVLQDFTKRYISLDFFATTSLVCVALFAVVYIVYFLVTYFISRRIVNAKTVEARVDH